MKAPTTSSGITQCFAEFVLNLKYDDLPAAVKEQAKNGLADLLGSALVGSVEESTRLVMRATTDGKKICGDATVLGTDTVATPAVAAMIILFLPSNENKLMPNRCIARDTGAMNVYSSVPSQRS